MMDHEDQFLGDENVASFLYDKRKGTVMTMQDVEGSAGEGGGSAEWTTNSRSRIRKVAATFERRNGRGRGRITVSQPLRVDISPFAFQQRCKESTRALKENVMHEGGSGPGNHSRRAMGKKRMLQKLGTKVTRRVPPVAAALDKENQKKHVREDAKSFFAREKALRAVEQKTLCASVPKNVFNSQVPNSQEHFSRVVAPQRRSGGRGIVFTKATPLDLSDLQEYFARLDQEETLEEVEEPELQVSFFRGKEAIHVARDEVEKKYEEKGHEAPLIQVPDLIKSGEIADQESQASADEILKVKVTPGCEQHVQLQAGSHEPQKLVVEEEAVSKGPTEIPDEESQAFSDEILEVQARQGHEPPVQLQARSYNSEELVAEEEAVSKPWIASVDEESQACGDEILDVQVTKWCGQPENLQMSQELQEVVVEEDVVSEVRVSVLREADLPDVEREAVEKHEEGKEKTMLIQAQEKPIESAQLKLQACEQPVQLEARSQELAAEDENLDGCQEMEDVAEVSSAEKVEFELSHAVQSVELWSVEFNQRHGSRDSFLLNEIRSSSFNPIQHGLPEQRMLTPMDEVSPKSPPPQTAQHLQAVNRNVIQYLTVPVPDTSPTPPTNPLSIFGPRFSRRGQSVELHQRRLFIDDEDGRNKPWTVDSAIVQPVESVIMHLLEHEQEDLATKSQSNVIAWTEQYSVDGDVGAMNNASASNQELQAASELGAQGGNSSPSGNHLIDTTGTIALISTESPAHDVHDVDGVKDLEGSKAMCEDSVQASEQLPGGILSELSMLEPNDQPITSKNEAPLPVQVPAVPECGRDVSTNDMPIDECAEDQQSNVGTSQAEPSMLANAESAPSACNTEVTPKKQQKQERQPRKKRKQVISPLDAGTKWQDGQRVSTRIKSKPLEWWRGERMLYGRIHSSLPTLIGIKHYSPDPVWPKARPRRGDRLHHKLYQVDSFVPEEYNEMIRLAAL